MPQQRIHKADVRQHSQQRPVDATRQLESELWAARLGHCGEWQLDVIPTAAEGLPPTFEYHPFRFVDHCEQARIRKQAATKTASRFQHCGARFYVDFGFLRASTSNYTKPNPKEDR
jgi:hypothetical protein